MDLLERYLQAISYLLPRREKDDIVRELSEDLRSQMEDREEQIGRALTEQEQAEILKRYGHPIQVAGNYRSRQYLIGPLFFPIYLFALELGFAAVLIVTGVLAVITALLYGDPVHHTLEAFLGLPGRALTVFAWTTLGFAALDLVQTRVKLTHNWDPRRLPKVVRPEYRFSRVHAAFEFLAGLLAVTWLLLVPANPFLVLGPAAVILDFAPVWRVAYLPILALTAGTAALSLANLVRPYRTATRSMLRIALQTGSLLVSGLLLQAGEWLVATPGATLGAGTSVERVVELANAAFAIGILTAAIIAAVEIGRELLRLKSLRKLSSSSESATVGATR